MSGLVPMDSQAGQQGHHINTCAWSLSYRSLFGQGHTINIVADGCMWSKHTCPDLCFPATCAEAGGLPDPSLLRTFEALQKTLLHLRGLMSRVGDGSAVTCSLIEAHRFLWDRYRSIRKDITQTELMHKVRSEALPGHTGKPSICW